MSVSLDAYVRVAEIEIDPVQLEAYKAAVSEEIEASVRVEPGVLAATQDMVTQLKLIDTVPIMLGAKAT